MYAQFLVLFGIIFVGFICRKRDIINDATTGGVNRLILNIALPCLIFEKTATLEMSASTIEAFFLTLAISLAALAAHGVIAYYYCKFRKYEADKSSVAEFGMMFPNNGFMGFPVTLIFFGDYGLFLMIANNTAMNLAAFSYGMALLRRGDGAKGQKLSHIDHLVKSLERIIINPNILATIAGLIVCLAGVSLPAAFDTFLTYLGGLATPLAMIMVGSILANGNILSGAKDRKVIESTIISNIVIPALTVLMVGFLPVDPMIKVIVVLAALFPCATLMVILSRETNRDSVFASEFLVLSTLLSMATLPLGIKLISMLFL